MNFIKDLGASYFVDAVVGNAFKNIRKICLTGNSTSERLKKFVKKTV